MNKNKTDRGRLSWVVTCWSAREWGGRRAKFVTIPDLSLRRYPSSSAHARRRSPSLRSPFAIIAAAVVCYAPIEADAARFVHT